ncbi:MAG: PIN domain-containing protein [Gemmatimonadales bacterium]|nr:MAG: PIN domain-containing protein [Gemmatimonadales bacterium]
MNFVLDASVVLSWAFEDERDASALRVLERLRESEAVTSSIWPLEVSNALLAAQRRGRIDPADAARFASHLLVLPIVVEPVERRASLVDLRRLAQDHDLSSYDASYLDVALRRGIPLATMDMALSRAAESAGVALVKG